MRRLTPRGLLIPVAIALGAISVQGQAPRQQSLRVSDVRVTGAKTTLRNMSAGTFTDVLRRRGYWRGSFDPPAATPAASGCRGAEVSIQTNEGAVYAWESAEWSGHTAMAVAELDLAPYSTTPTRAPLSPPNSGR